MLKYLPLLLVFSTATAQRQLKVYFDFDKDEINTVSQAVLTNWLNDNRKAEVVKIYGYTDTIGNKYYNTDLSQRRAAFITKQLKQNSVIFSDAVLTEGYGETNSEITAARNRYVCIYYNEHKAEEPQLTTAVSTAVKGDKLKLPGLNFYNNSAMVLPESQPLLEELLDILEKNPKLKIEVQGHICCQPVELEKISYYRAEAIYLFLIKNGIDTDRLSFTSFGSSNPIYPLPEKNEEQRRANRRVEIEILSN